MVSSSRPAAEARLALRRDDSSAPALVAALPAPARADPGLVLDFARWQRRANQDRAALAIWIKDGGPAEAAATPDGLTLDGVRRRARAVRDGDDLTVVLDGRNHPLSHRDPRAPPRAAAASGDRVASPIPARVARVLVAPGDTVARGAPLLVVEAMKTELTLRAPLDAVFAEVRAAPGYMIPEGRELVTFEVK